MTAVLTLLVVLVLSLIVVRVATVALMQTGITKDLARFEARSAFTGAGYTTRQSELMIGHPVRRRIVMLLMLLGSAGHVTFISSLILSVVGIRDDSSTDSIEVTMPNQLWNRIAVLIAGLTILWIIGHSDWIDKQITRAIKWALKHFAQLELIDYVGLLHLSGGYEVAELEVTADSWLTDKSLAELRMTDENTLVLGVNRPDGQYIGTPPHNYVLREHDNLIIYGPESVIRDVDSRPSGEAGDRAHLESIRRQAERADSSS